jgi:hypothetical protein
MNSKLIKALSIVCLVFIAVITLEWFYATNAQEQLLSSISQPSKQAVTDKMPTINLNAQTEAVYVDLVNRPLFISGRKPVAEVDQTPEQVTAGVAGTFDWQLNGILTTKKGLMALLTRTIVKTPSDKYRKVIVGDNIEGWKVAQIHADKIQLTQGSTQKELLLRKLKAKKQEQNGAIPTNSRSRHANMPEPTNDSSENNTNAHDQ